MRRNVGLIISSIVVLFAVICFGFVYFLINKSNEPKDYVLIVRTDEKGKDIYKLKDSNIYNEESSLEIRFEDGSGLFIPIENKDIQIIPCEAGDKIWDSYEDNTPER